MIRSIEIKGLRGIREGKLDDLAPLTVLVGPNGSGKSTILDALLIGASPTPQDALIQTVQRRPQVRRGARWLLWRAGGAEKSEVVLKSDSSLTSPRRWELSFKDRQVPNAMIYTITRIPDDELTGNMMFSDNNEFEGGGQMLSRHAGFVSQQQTIDEISRLSDIPEIRLLDARAVSQDTSLHQLYSTSVEQGRSQQAKAIIAEVVPGLVRIEILTEGDHPVVHLVFDEYSVPAALAGDGVQMLLRLSLELASRAGGVVLLEEPEVHQHPGAIRQSALAILAAVKRDIQVILTTHSLELIDALLAGASDADLERIAVYRLQLEDGQLKSSRLSGPDAAFARTQIEDDLR